MSVCIKRGDRHILPPNSLGFGAVFPLFGSTFKLVFSLGSIVAAFACSTLIGVGFGFLPARSASELDPIEALARE